MNTCYILTDALRVAPLEFHVPLYIDQLTSLVVAREQDVRSDLDSPMAGGTRHDHHVTRRQIGKPNLEYQTMGHRLVGHATM